MKGFLYLPPRLCDMNYLGAEVDVLCQRAVGEGILEVVGIHTGTMGDHMQVM